jgi:hypothetical protein
VRFIPEPLLTWADLRDIRFEEPFFRDTLHRISQERTKALTGIKELRALDNRPFLTPSLFVFQISRCGSTLLSQMLASLPENVVVSEPSVINETLLGPSNPDEKVELLRLLIRALGRNCRTEAKHLIVKLTSWNVLFTDLLHQAFPETPKIWLQRRPLEVVASHAAGPAGWMAWRETRDPAVSMLGVTIDEAVSMTASRFLLHAIEALYRAARDARLSWQVVDYRELPHALLEKISPYSGLSWDASQKACMRERALFDSKTSEPKSFEAKDRTSLLSDEERRFVAERIDPLYRAIDHQEPPTR